LTNFKFTKSKILVKIFKKLEDSCLKASDVVITICPDLAAYVKNFLKGDESHILIENSIFEPVRLINSSTDKKDFRSSDEKAYKGYLDLPTERKLVVYAGTLEPYQGIDILIKAFQKVLEETPDAFLVVVGGNAKQVDLYSKLAGDLKLNGHIKFTGRVTQELAKQICAAASVQISPRSGGTNTPLKIYEQLASGIPLVATNIYSHTQVLGPEVAILVMPNPEAMARGIISALKSDILREKVVRNAKKLYEEKYSRPIYEQKMRTVLKLVT
jgi:glycosyltransferase involved in cell wall biosynthesis